ncbi:MAG: 4-diphosphocytidyl-2C-methyl-D-erythritol kinase [Lysinibacillus sp.]
MEYPLLYIHTPPPARQIEEESTSIYVKKEAVPSLILHQLRYFSLPLNKERKLYFQLKNGEHLDGTIDKVKGEEVLVNALGQKIWLAAESIAYITIK